NGRSTRRGPPTADKAFALGALARQLACAAHRFGLFACALLGRLLVMSAHLHLAENAFALHLLLQRAKRLVDIVVADEYLHVGFLSEVASQSGEFSFAFAHRQTPPRRDSTTNSGGS